MSEAPGAVYRATPQGGTGRLGAARRSARGDGDHRIVVRAGLGRPGARPVATAATGSKTT